LDAICGFFSLHGFIAYHLEQKVAVVGNAKQGESQLYTCSLLLSKLNKDTHESQ